MTGIEVLAAQAVSGIAVPIFQSLWGTGGKFQGRSIRAIRLAILPRFSIPNADATQRRYR